MHDSLPAGDLTELLGHPGTTESSQEASIEDRLVPLDPGHPLQPLASGLDERAPYHIIVVGGQEVPVGYGGWSGPNWTEIIERWLSGTSVGAMQAAQAAQAQAQAQAQSQAGTRLSGQDQSQAASPVVQQQQQQQEDAGPSQQVQGPEVQDEEDDSATPDATTPSAGVQLDQQTGTGSEVLTSSAVSAGPTAALHPPELDASLAGAAPSMDRADSSGSAKTQLTDESRISAASSTATTTGTASGASASAAAQPSTSDETSLPQPAGTATARYTEPPYALVAKERLMGIYCSVWVYRPCLHLIRGSSTGTVTAGLLNGKLGNKGAACISLWIANTRLLFVCAHLAAHSERANVRQQNVRKIKEELVIETFKEAQRASEEGADEADAAFEHAGTPVPVPVPVPMQTAQTQTAEPSKEKRFSSNSTAYAHAVGHALHGGHAVKDQAQSDKDREKDNRDRHRERLVEERNQRKEAGGDLTEEFDFTFWFGDRRSPVNL